MQGSCRRIQGGKEKKAWSEAELTKSFGNLGVINFDVVDSQDCMEQFSFILRCPIDDLGSFWHFCWLFGDSS